jgi:HEAT repeat protein
MGLFDSFHVSRSIATILSGRNASAEVVAAASRLRDVGRGAIPKIITALADEPAGDPLTRLLADMITTAALPVVVDQGMLNQDPQIVSRVRSALAGGSKYDPNRLIELYTGAGGALVNLSDVILARRDDITPKSVMRILDSAHKDNQPTLFKVVADLANEKMVPALIGFSRNAEWEGRYCIAQTIARFVSNEPVRDCLLRFIKDPHKLVRQAAVEGLGAMQVAVPAAPLVELLRDTDLMVQTKAIETLIKINDPSSVRQLLGVLQDESEQARRAAVEVLNAIGDASAIKDLLQAMKDHDWWVRVRAADALGAIGGPKVIDAVLELLGDDDEFMRRCAIEILNMTKDPRAFASLIAALDDPDWWVRERALDALANMRDPRAIPAIQRFLEEDNEGTPVAIRALVTIGDPSAVPAITAKLESTDEAILRETITALETLTEAKSANPVLKALTDFRKRAVAADIIECATRAHAVITTRVRGRTPSGDAPFQAAAAPMSMLAGNAERARPANRPAPASEPEAVDPPLSPREPERPTAAFAVNTPPVVDSGDLSNVSPGDVIGGRYKVKRELGRGGFGIVLLVEDQMVQEEIALKVISPHLTQDEIAIARMVHEVRYARKITHENVIRIHDFMRVGSTYAMSMEYFASTPLNRKMRRGRPVPEQEALRYARDILRGIGVAHAADIVHRDLKPANILIDTAGVLKIVDFGLAAAMSNTNSRVTKSGYLVGTPSYMAPEQVRGMVIDQRTDIYSLGVILYELCTGVVPYSADNPMAVLFQHLEGAKVAPSKRNPEISTVLEAIILKAMALKPEERYPSAAEMLTDVEALMMKVAA